MRELERAGRLRLPAGGWIARTVERVTVAVRRGHVERRVESDRGIIVPLVRQRHPADIEQRMDVGDDVLMRRDDLFFDVEQPGRPDRTGLDAVRMRIDVDQ